MTEPKARSSIPTFTREQLAYLASLRQTETAVFEAVSSGTHPIAALMALGARAPMQPVLLAKVGDVVEGRGVYLGEWEAAKGHVVHAYAADDFLRDAKGNQLVLTYNDSVKELTRRNGGWQAGNGADAALRHEIAKGGNDFEGKLVLPSKELLHGRDVRGKETRPLANVYALLKSGKLPKIARTLQEDGTDKWAFSGSGRPDGSSGVYPVSLVGGGGLWDTRASHRSGAVPVRLYRQPKATGPTPQVGG